MKPKKKHWRKPKYRKRVEALLRLYPVYKKALEDEEATDIRLSPSLVSFISETKVVGGYKEYSSTTEEYGIKRAEMSRLVDAIELAMTVLDPDEREVIEATYFAIDRPKVYIVFEELGISKRSYYRIKQRAMEKLAIMLRMF